jgi:hypothetical protein
MKYCSIEEAWGKNNINNENNETYSKPHEKKFSNTIDFLMSNNKPNHAVDLYEGFTATGEYQNNIEKKINNYLEKFDYLIKYEPFREKILNRVEKFLNKKIEKNIEHFSLSGGNDDDYSDVLLLIIFGIFIIFVLDAFVKLGMKFSKN